MKQVLFYILCLSQIFLKKKIFGSFSRFEKPMCYNIGIYCNSLQTTDLTLYLSGGVNSLKNCLQKYD